MNTEEAICYLIERCHFTAIEKGWWDDLERNNGELIALMHSELSEALEGLRKPQQSDHIPKFTLVEEEMADLLIRVFDFAGARELRLAEALTAKMAYNKTRPYRHGKLF